MKQNENERRFRVWHLRHEGATQSQIAEELGISQPSVSLICGWLDDAEEVFRLIQAHHQTTGNASIDALEQQATMLEIAQMRLKPGSKEYLAHSEQIGWLRLKAAELRNAVSPSETQTEFHYTCSVDVWPIYKVELRPKGDDTDELRQEFIKAGRVQTLKCPICGCPVNAHLQLPPQTPRDSGATVVDSR